MQKKFESGIRKKLLAWYARHQRDLPWRHTSDPYRIWVSEIMLQQTRVDTVIPYYKRFIKTFPNVGRLAQAPLDEVLKAWENLGYYSRARHLHAAAKSIVENYHGRLPGDFKELISLAGIGPYTASALLSIAFHKSLPAVDANVARVIGRLRAIEQSLQDREALKKIEETAAHLVPLKRPGHFNQALMDLGAGFCLARRPLCKACPLASLCRAWKRKLQDKIPVRSIRRPLPHKDMTAAILIKHGRLLIVKRPGRGLLGGLWKLPGGECDGRQSLKTNLIHAVRQELGVALKTGQNLFSVRHGYSHFRVTVHVFDGLGIKGRLKALGCADWKWVPLKQLPAYAFSKADREIMRVFFERNKRGC